LAQQSGRRQEGFRNSNPAKMAVAELILTAA
jgi:hypothetical protein